MTLSGLMAALVSPRVNQSGQSFIPIAKKPTAITIHATVDTL
jgi:hypothetical protein